MHLYVHCSIIYNSQDVEATQVPFYGRMDKEDVIYIDNGYYSALKKDKIVPFATTWMDLKGIKLHEISQTEKDKHHMISLICGK